jgi:hypothetical protein
MRNGVPVHRAAHTFLVALRWAPTLAERRGLVAGVVDAAVAAIGVGISSAVPPPILGDPSFPTGSRRTRFMRGVSSSWWSRMPGATAGTPPPTGLAATEGDRTTLPNAAAASANGPMRLGDMAGDVAVAGTGPATGATAGAAALSAAPGIISLRPSTTTEPKLVVAVAVARGTGVGIATGTAAGAVGVAPNRNELTAALLGVMLVTAVRSLCGQTRP